MCGITAIFNIHDGAQALRKQALLMSKRIRHRGPDWSGIYQGKTAILAHERLSIVDPASGGQPLVSPDGKLILCVNGEIYNHQELRERLKGDYEFQTGSDCEVILALYKKKGIDFIEDLNGIFAFICRNILGCKKYISKLKDMDAPAIICLLYNKDICKCSSCGGKIIPLPTEQHFIKPKPHMLC